MGVAVDAVGQVAICASTEACVKIARTDGTLVTTIGEQGSGEGQFFEPYAVAVDNVGRFAVADMLNHRVQVFCF